MRKSIILYIMAISFLCACGASPSATVSGNSNSESPPEGLEVGTEFGNDTDSSEFVSDYLAGEENFEGNLWTNRMFCRQGEYIYHFNEAEKCLEKWHSDEDIENAEIICYVDTKMLPVDGDHSEFYNHIEVVGDYIYLCLMNGEKRGDANLTTIVCYRTDGNVQATVAADCVNCQYRIIDGFLFYLTVVHLQEDMNTEEYCIAIKSIDLRDFNPTDPDDAPLSLLVEDSLATVPKRSSDGGFNPENLFVMADGENYILGYQYSCTQSSYGDNRYSIRYILEIVEEDYLVGFSKKDFQSVANVGNIYGAESDGEILIRNESGTYSIDINSWPNDIQSGVSVLPERKIIRCVAEDYIFFNDFDDDVMFALNRSTGEQWQVNNDGPNAVEYVNNGKIYYYEYKSHKYYLCSCNVDGSDWRQIYSYA